MEASQALQDTLKSMTKVYHNETVPIKFGSAPRVVPEGKRLQGETVTEPTVVINPAPGNKFSYSLSGPEELSCITNTLSHELEHIRQSELTCKATFRKQYQTHPHFAGGIINILEDQYIDYTRTRRFPGLKSTEAFVIDKLYRDDDLWPPIHTIEKTPKAMLEGVRQVAFCGHAKGITQAEEWLRTFLSRVRPYIKSVRREDSQQRRAKIGHDVMEIAEEFLPDADLEMPKSCLVCDDDPPEIIAPLRGPVCDDCAPTGHSLQGNAASEEQTDSGTSGHEATGASDNPDSGIDEGKNRVSSSKPTDESADNIRESGQSIGKQEPQSDGDTEDSESTGLFHPSEELSTMDSLDRNEDHASWWDVPDTVEYQSVSDENVRLFERIQMESESTTQMVDDSEYGTSADLVSNLRQHREIAQRSTQTIDETEGTQSRNLRTSALWRTLRDDFRRVFREITTREVSVPSRVGDKLHMDSVVQRAAGDKSRHKLYDRSQSIAQGGRIVAVSTDMSGSMDEMQVKLSLAAIAEATEMVGDDLLATCWSDGGDSSEGYVQKHGSTRFGLVCGVNESFEWKQLDMFRVGGGTPTADGVDITADLIEHLGAREKLLLVITDGMPNSTYGGNGSKLTGCPVGDAKKVVQNARSKNIKVIGLCVDSPDEDNEMAEIFGERGYVSASMDNLAQELIGVYRDQLRV